MGLFSLLDGESINWIFVSNKWPVRLFGTLELPLISIIMCLYSFWVDPFQSFWDFSNFKDVLEASNVKECTLIKRGCANYPCINGGECKPLPKNDYECVCGQKFR